MERHNTPEAPAKPVTCPICGSTSVVRWGKDRHGAQRFLCRSEKPHTFVTVKPEPGPLGTMRLPVEKATVVLSLLVEGSSIRSAERVTGVHRDTICRLLSVVGPKCQVLLDRMVQGVKVSDVQADEIWGFVQKKEATKRRTGDLDPETGDAWTFVAIERESKLVLAHHLGQRTSLDADTFIEKLDRATTGRFQLTTDGLSAYPEAVSYHLGHRTDYAQLIKTYGTDQSEPERRYSPATIIGTEKRPVHGEPDEFKICTSHVERQNLTMRMQMRRLTRLTNGFSKKWANLQAALALHFAHYNLCRVHRTIRCTPAMAAGVTSTIWKMGDLLAA
ncbi:MAG: IS1 family transposase [Thermoanaerobaculia bacterium]|nr:IS1 family transposase [Thermoanaerobaculia bacterium]